MENIFSKEDNIDNDQELNVANNSSDAEFNDSQDNENDLGTGNIAGPKGESEGEDSFFQRYDSDDNAMEESKPNQEDNVLENMLSSSDQLHIPSMKNKVSNESDLRFSDNIIMPNSLSLDKKDKKPELKTKKEIEEEEREKMQ